MIADGKHSFDEERQELSVSCSSWSFSRSGGIRAEVFRLGSR
jgi:hypothetical protein